MYLQKPRIFMFLLTQALVGAEVGLSSWSLADGYHKKALARKTLPGAELDIMSAFAVGGSVTAAAGLSSILCGILLLYTVFHPRKPETLRSIRIKEGLFAAVSILLLAALIPATYINATKAGVIKAPGIPPAIIAQLVKAAGQDLRYKVQTPIIAYLVTGWLAFLSTLVTAALVSIAARKTHKYGVDQAGPLAVGAEVRDRRDVETDSALAGHDEKRGVLHMERTETRERAL
ncbi:hypothetical protein JCM10449v2_004755 [Rhodotorula kratochvilovae]